jgi:hypothetical protein
MLIYVSALGHNFEFSIVENVWDACEIWLPKQNLF